MAKRFTDTDKWKKPFLRSMKAPYKLLWLYILDECDHAGIWQVDVSVAEIKTGERLNLQKALEQFSGRVEILQAGEKWFIPDFIEFQYGTLNPENRAHNSVISILKKFDLLNSDYTIKPLTSPLQGAKDKETEKVKELVTEKVFIHPLQKIIFDKFPKVGKIETQPTLQNFEYLERQFGLAAVENIFAAMENKKGVEKFYTSVYLTALTWLKRDKKDLNTGKVKPNELTPATNTPADGWGKLN